jgi:hypothetical protein
MSKYVGAGKKVFQFLTPKPKVNKTKLDKANSNLDIAIHKNKASKAKLNQTIFEMENKMPITFKGNKGKSESNKEAYKRIQGENTKTIKSMLDKATENKKDGGRIGRKFGGGTDLRDIPAGKKYAGLKKLPKKVRNKMKFKKNGGKI